MSCDEAASPRLEMTTASDRLREQIQSHNSEGTPPQNNSGVGTGISPRPVQTPSDRSREQMQSHNPEATRSPQPVQTPYDRLQKNVQGYNSNGMVLPPNDNGEDISPRLVRTPSDRLREKIQSQNSTQQPVQTQSQKSHGSTPHVHFQKLNHMTGPDTLTAEDRRPEYTKSMGFVDGDVTHSDGRGIEKDLLQMKKARPELVSAEDRYPVESQVELEKGSYFDHRRTTGRDQGSSSGRMTVRLHREDQTRPSVQNTAMTRSQLNANGIIIGAVAVAGPQISGVQPGGDEIGVNARQEQVEDDVSTFVASANLVDDDELEARIARDLIQRSADAVEVKPDEIEESRKAASRYKICGIATFFLLLVGIGALLGILIPAGRGEETPSDEEFLEQTLVAVSGESIFDSLSPQHKAYKWLLHDTGVEYPLDRDMTSLMVDRYVLALLYYSTSGQNWTKQYNFLSNSSICEWHISIDAEDDETNGVRCDDNGNVIEVHLDANELRGTLPSEFSAMSVLEVLSLSNNEIDGSIPSSISELGWLEKLYLSDNLFTSTLPDSIAGLTKLEVLDISSCLLTGTIPNGLPSITTLQELSLHSNRLSGTVPDFMPRSDMRRIALSQNFLSGTIPASTMMLGRLEELDLHNTHMSGTLPTEIGLLGKLRILYLGKSRFEGQLPSELGRLTELEELWTHRNILNGTLPSDLGNCRSLKKLYTGYNGNLTGTIPSQLARLSQLKSFSVTNTKVTGTLPFELISLNRLGTRAHVLFLVLQWVFLNSRINFYFLFRFILDVVELHQTHMSGSLDPIFCNRSIPPQFLSADCSGNPPEVNCTCCTTCCDGPSCQQDAMNVCRAYKNYFEGLEASVHGTVCNCSDDGLHVSCNDTACQSCNDGGSVCSTSYDYGHNSGLGAPEYDRIYYCNMKYSLGRNEDISLRLDRLTAECSVHINRQACNSCKQIVCRDGYVGYRIDCSNIEDDAMFNDCEGMTNSGGVLELFSAEFAQGECVPCYAYE